MTGNGFEEFLRAAGDSVVHLRAPDPIAAAAARAGFLVTAADVDAGFQRRSLYAQIHRMRGCLGPVPSAPKLRDEVKWNAIRLMDLSAVSAQMESEYGWDPRRVQTVVEDYRRFFYLTVTCREGEACAPTPEIDEVWHRHILNTRQYRDDCEKYAGTFVHHDVGDTRKGEVSPPVMRAFAQTAIRWETEFGTPYPPEETLGEALVRRPCYAA